MFTVKGNILNTKRSVTYDAGKLAGDRLVVDLVNIEAQAMEGRAVGPIGQYTSSNHLHDPLSALSLIMGVFTTIEEITGDVPEAEEAPEGAII